MAGELTGEGPKRRGWAFDGELIGVGPTHCGRAFNDHFQVIDVGCDAVDKGNVSNEHVRSWSSMLAMDGL